MNNPQDQLITLTSFDNSFQAHLFRNYLAESGIEAYVFDENLVSINPLFNNLIGGIKVKVSLSDLGHAREILKEYNSASLTDEENETMVCPNCGSAELETNFKTASSTKSKLAMVISLFTGTYPLHLENGYYCKNCKKAFHKK